MSPHSLCFSQCRLTRIVRFRMQTSAPALYPQATLALTAIYLSTRLVSPPISLPLSSPSTWWELFDASEQDLVHVSTMLGETYRDWNTSFPGVARNAKQEKVNIWRQAGGLPITKRAVRDSLEKMGVKGNGSEKK